MSEERKPVMCPWCGAEMQLDPYHDEPKRYASYERWYVCECKATSPAGYGGTMEQAEEAAYAAATKRPPNLPLTREQVEKMPDLAAVWSHGTLLCQLHAAKDVRRFIQRGWTDGEMFFAAHPTPADIEAARKERANGTC